MDSTIALAPGEIWLYTIKAHAFVMLGRTDEARAIYLKYRGQNVRDGRSWEAIVLEEFIELRKAGFTSPLMDEIEKPFASAG